jgi:hypothetical protein
MQIKKLKNKKAQEVFGMSFGMIFTIILIIFFFSAAFFGIRAFLEYQKQAQIGMFYEKFQGDIDSAWHSSSASFYSNSSLPAGIEYVCFVNLTKPSTSSNTIENTIYNAMKRNFVAGRNIYLYAPSKDYGLNWNTINHLELPSRNPYCIKVNNKLISIKIERQFEDRYPSVS